MQLFGDGIKFEPVLAAPTAGHLEDGVEGCLFEGLGFKVLEAVKIGAEEGLEGAVVGVVWAFVAVLCEVAGK